MDCYFVLIKVMYGFGVFIKVIVKWLVIMNVF